MDVIGHRGWPRPEHPENTVAAVRAALAAGAQGVEIDVRLASDGVPVCCHDADLTRVCGQPVAVRRAPAPDVHRLSGGRVPLLRQVLAVVPRDILLVLDLKPGPDPRGLVAGVVRELQAGARRSRRAVLSSVDRHVLRAAAQLAPAWPRALISAVGAGASQTVAEAAGSEDAAVHLRLDALLADPAALAQAGRSGLQVRCWTVNRAVDARLLDQVGVNGLITDEPDMVLAALATEPAFT